MIRWFQRKHRPTRVWGWDADARQAWWANIADGQRRVRSFHAMRDDGAIMSGHTPRYAVVMDAHPVEVWPTWAWADQSDFRLPEGL